MGNKSVRGVALIKGRLKWDLLNWTTHIVHFPTPLSYMNCVWPFHYLLDHNFNKLHFFGSRQCMLWSK